MYEDEKRIDVDEPCPRHPYLRYHLLGHTYVPSGPAALANHISAVDDAFVCLISAHVVEARDAL